MDFDDIVKIVDQVKVLEARLAKAEAEQEKHQGLANNRLNCMALYRDLIGKHEARIGVLAHKLDLAEAERDAALAEVERLREKADLLDWIEQKIGNVYEGIETVRLHRDDATNSFIVAIGKDSLAGYGHSLVAALRAAKAGGK